MASSRSAAPRRHKRLQIGVSGRLDRTLAFQELCADTGGLDYERTMSDADGGGLATRRPFGPRSALPASSVSRLPSRSRQEAVSERAQEALADDVHARDEIAFDAMRLQEVASGDRRAVERAHDLTDVDSGPAIVQLTEARRLVVRARSGPLLGPVRAHLLL